jgi:hypothetical protein
MTWTFSMEGQSRLRYHNGQKEDEEYCVKEDIGKYDMWYDVVYKTMSWDTSFPDP